MKRIFMPANFILIIFSLLAIIVLSPILAIFLGLIYSLIYKNNAQAISTKISTIPLQVGIVLIGFTILSFLCSSSMNNLRVVDLLASVVVDLISLVCCAVPRGCLLVLLHLSHAVEGGNTSWSYLWAGAVTFGSTWPGTS